MKANKSRYVLFFSACSFYLSSILILFMAFVIDKPVDEYGQRVIPLWETICSFLLILVFFLSLLVLLISFFFWLRFVLRLRREGIVKPEFSPEEATLYQYVYSDRLTFRELNKVTFYLTSLQTIFFLFVPIATIPLLIADRIKNGSNNLLAIPGVLILFLVFLLFLVYVISPWRIQQSTKKIVGQSTVSLYHDRITQVTHLSIASDSLGQKRESVVENTVSFRQVFKAREDQNLYYFYYYGPKGKPICLVLKKRNISDPQILSFLSEKVKELSGK